MKYLILTLLALVSKTEVVFACPDFSGQYEFVEEPWNGSIQIEQRDCASVTVTRIRRVAVSALYPNGVWSQVQNLKTDARPYVGFDDSTKLANAKTKSFQKVSWENDRLVIRQYFGSAKKCEGRYFLNRTDCHVTEYSINQGADGIGYAWAQTGLWWREGGPYSNDFYILIRKSENSPPVSRVAQNRRGSASNFDKI